MTEQDILAGLNPPQTEAVKQLTGPLLVLAGAGSGKTSVITRRIAYGLQQGVIEPDKFLAVTFTNKAAGEMRERISNLTGLSPHKLWVKTFHSTCAAILREEAASAGLSRYFSIYDPQDQLNLVKSILKESISAQEKFTPSLLLNSISRAKDGALSPQEAIETYDDPQFQETFLTVYREYNKRLHESDALDFGDLIFKTVQLFSISQEIHQKYCELFPYILVDEYQDTNRAQYLFIKALSSKSRNICVVGDDDQAIYNWRGADVTNILNFEKDFPEAKIIKLEQNYRSTTQILDVAGEVIKNNSARLGKQLWSEQTDGIRPYFYEAQDDREEAAYVAATIQEYCSTGENYKDIAVFYRTNWQSRVIEETFVRNKIPYSLTGGTKFYERKEVKDLLTYLRLSVNPSDELAFIRAISTPSRGVGKKTQQKIIEFAKQNNLDLIEAARNSSKCTAIKGKKGINALQEFANIFKAIQSLESIYEAVNETLLISGLSEHYQEDQERLENILEFANGVKLYEEANPSHSMADFLVEIALMTGSDTSTGKKEGVQLMTIHNAKGLEFGIVFMTGMEQGLFPHFLANESEKGEEEERRLFYVGVTRAKQLLHLSSAAQRLAYGKISYNDISQFVEEIPQQLISNIATNKRITTIRNNTQLTTSKKKSPKLHFAVGDRVKHPEYGEGIITTRQGAGAMTRVHVAFEDRTCLFIEQYSKLEKIAE